VLYEDPGRGEMTCLLKLEPGAYLPFKHPEIEQTLVLEGSVEEHDGTATADSGEDVDSIDSERSHDRPIWWRTT